MRSLKPIAMTGQQVRRSIVPGINSEDRRKRLEADEYSVLGEEIAFRKAVSDGDAVTVQPAEYTEIVKKDMIWLYETRLRSSTSGRSLRQKLIAATDGLCPYCRINKARTLDHTVPKSKHPRLSVEPLNLVPCCRDCNMDRGVGKELVGVSPFFDQWATDELWLNAYVADPSRPEDLAFSPLRHPTYSDAQWARLSNFFEGSGLRERYKLLALDEYYVLADDLKRHGLSGSVDSVVDSILERLLSRVARKGPNCWEAASYGAWLVHARDISWL